MEFPTAAKPLCLCMTSFIRSHFLEFHKGLHDLRTLSKFNSVGWPMILATAMLALGMVPVQHHGRQRTQLYFLSDFKHIKPGLQVKSQEFTLPAFYFRRKLEGISPRQNSVVYLFFNAASSNDKEGAGHPGHLPALGQRQYNVPCRQFRLLWEEFLLNAVRPSQEHGFLKLPAFPWSLALGLRLMSNQ